MRPSGVGNTTGKDKGENAITGRTGSFGPHRSATRPVLQSGQRLQPHQIAQLEPHRSNHGESMPQHLHTQRHLVFQTKPTSKPATITMTDPVMTSRDNCSNFMNNPDTQLNVPMRVASPTPWG